MLSRLRAIKARRSIPPKLTAVNYTAEHVRVAKTLERRKRIADAIWARLGIVRAILAAVGILWLFALPYHGLWKGTYIDEHAIQPAQVTMYYDWADVHRADRYLDELERIVNGTFEERSTYVQGAFAKAGLTSGSTSTATWARVSPPRSASTETILVSANWVSRDGVPNLRGVATLLSLGNFLRGQNHWAFDFALVIGDSYLSGLDTFMSPPSSSTEEHYHTIFPGVIWTALNIDYPGHSFSHIGVFYEGLNGRLPNQDVPNTLSHVGRWAGGVDMRLHNIDNHLDADEYKLVPKWGREYWVAARHLWEHAKYTALGRASGAHGVLAKHRIDASTLYCTPATGPHGFHTLGRTLESTLRSLNNLLERLHASYFFYLLPRPGKFIPVGHYLPSAVLLGASITLGGFDCPDPLQGVLYLLPGYALALLCWITQMPALLALAFPWVYIMLTDRHKGKRRSARSLMRLLYGALIPTLAMVNFPQAILLALIVLAADVGLLLLIFAFGAVPLAVGGHYIGLHKLLAAGQAEWALGNVTYPATYAVVIPLIAALWSFPSLPLSLIGALWCLPSLPS